MGATELSTDDESVTELSTDDEGGSGRRVFSVGFGWRSGADWSSGGNGRRSVRWYADCLHDLLYHHARADSTCRFVVHLHGAMTCLDTLTASLRRAFEDGRASALVRRRDPRGVTVRVCDARLPPMWPQAARAITLFDHPSHADTVLLVDVHDDPRKQSAAADQLAEEAFATGKSLGLTFWKSEGDLASSVRDDAVAPPVLLRVDRTAAMIAKDQHWNLDAGLALTTGRFRARLRRQAMESYAQFLERMGPRVLYDETRGTDEGLLKLYLLTQPPIRTLVRTASVLRTHTLYSRSDDPPRRCPDLSACRPGPASPPPPHPLVFAYDAEHPRALASRSLAWEAERRRRDAASARAQKRGRHGDSPIPASDASVRNLRGGA